VLEEPIPRGFHIEKAFKILVSHFAENRLGQVEVLNEAFRWIDQVVHMTTYLMSRHLIHSLPHGVCIRTKQDPFRPLDEERPNSSSLRVGERVPSLKDITSAGVDVKIGMLFK